VPLDGAALEVPLDGAALEVPLDGAAVDVLVGATACVTGAAACVTACVTGAVETGRSASAVELVKAQASTRTASAVRTVARRTWRGR
jgi:hypothetical protein